MKHFYALLLCAILPLFVFAEEIYQIKRLKGNVEQIEIGGKLLKEGDKFSGDAHIKWTSECVGMQVVNMSDGKIYMLSETQFATRNAKSIQSYFTSIEKASTRSVSVRSANVVFAESPNKSLFPEKRIALLLGNVNYMHMDKLRTPLNDVSDIAQSLLNLGFDVYLAYDCTWSDTRAVMHQFVTAASKYDVAMFYYAGHGVQDDGTNYIVPVDADLQLRSDLEYCYKISGIVADIETSQCATRLMFFDACRNVKTWKRSASNNGLGAMEASRGSAIVFSTESGNTADDGDSDNSPFAKAVLENIATPNVEFEGVVTKIQRSTYASTNGLQFPCYSSRLLSSFSFNPNASGENPLAESTKTPASQNSTPLARVPVQPKQIGTIKLSAPGYDANVLGCYRVANDVYIEYTVTSTSKSSYCFPFNEGDISRNLNVAYDDDGNVYNRSQYNIFTINPHGFMSHCNMPKNIPIRFKIKLTDVPGSIGEIKLCKRSYGFGGYDWGKDTMLEMRDLPISEYSADEIEKNYLLVLEKYNQAEQKFNWSIIGLSDVKGNLRYYTSGDNVYLEFTLTNNGSKSLKLWPGDFGPVGSKLYETMAIDCYGNHCYKEGWSDRQIKLLSSGGIELPSGVPVKIKFVIQNIGAGTQSIPYASIAFSVNNDSANKALFVIHNLQLSWKQ